MKKYIAGTLAVIAVIVLALSVMFKDRFERAQMVATLFTGAEQDHNFNRSHRLFPSAEMPASGVSTPWPEGAAMALPERFTHDGESYDTAEFLDLTDTSALLVLHEGAVVYEDYALTGGRDVPWISMSVSKSFVSALIGIAISEGHIGSIEEPITDYVPGLAGSAYDGVAIKDILQMSSGARWNEDYSDPDSDISRFGRIFALGGSLNAFAATLTRENEPGTFNRYNSTDTQVLGMLLVAATGRPITDYMNEKLWTPLGAAYPAYWLLDAEGMEMAFGGMNATARDYARLGELYRLGGAWQGEQIVPADWIAASVTPDAPHLMPGADNPASDFALGYGYQWWIPEGDRGEFTAIGVYNQFIFVDPAAGMVIVKLSASSDYGATEDESGYREFETIELFREIVRTRLAGVN